MQSATSPDSTRKLDEIRIEDPKDAVVVIHTALEIAGQSRDFIAGTIAAEKLHGCLRAGAPLWVHKAGAETYRRAARANPPSAPVCTPADT